MAWLFENDVLSCGESWSCRGPPANDVRQRGCWTFVLGRQHVYDAVAKNGESITGDSEQKTSHALEKSKT